MILFTADWHIALNKKNIPKHWAIERYKSFFDQVHEICEVDNIDIHIIGGDLMDKAPNLEELELYFDFISSCIVPTIIYSGNHEATRKHQTFLSSLKDVTNMVNPLVTIVDEVTEFEWGTIVPYCELHKKGVLEGLNETKPLFTHVRGEIPPHVKPEIDLSILKNFPIVYAGDLHAHSNSQLNIVYPGSPMTASFHRNVVETGYLIIEGVGWKWMPFKLPQLIRATVTDPNKMVATDYHHTIYELEGDLAELSNVKNTDLLDKKVVKRNSEAGLILDGNMTVTEELSEYLLYILELPEDTVTNILGTFHDNTQAAQME